MCPEVPNIFVGFAKFYYLYTVAWCILYLIKLIPQNNLSSDSYSPLWGWHDNWHSWSTYFFWFQDFVFLILEKYKG